MKTSKLFFLLISIVFFLSACSTPPERIIKYTTNDYSVIEFKEGKFGDAKLISNEFNKKEQCFYAKFDKELTVIGEEAFLNKSALTSITIPNSVTSIENSAFSGCKKLATIVIPNSVTSIGNYAFSGCTGLTAVHISDLSAWCNIDFVDYSSNPLYDASLYLNGGFVRELVIPDDVTKIKKYAFSGCSGLTSVTIPNSVTSIGEHAFYGCENLVELTFPDSITKIEKYCFARCIGLRSIFIPEGCESIGNCAFRGCEGLINVRIPMSVTYIGDNAFEGCKKLDHINVPNKNAVIGHDAFRFDIFKGVFY